MTTQQLLAVDLLAAILAAVLFFAAAALTLSPLAARRPGGRVADRSIAAAAVACSGLALLVTLGRVPVVLALLKRGWPFAADRIVLSLPLAVLTAMFAAVVATPAVLRWIGGRSVAPAARPQAGAALLIAGYGAAAAVLVTLVVGYPLTISGVATVLCLVAGLSGLTWLGLRRARRPGWSAGLILLCLVPVLVTAGMAFYREIQPVIIGAGGSHGHLAAGPAVGGPGAGGAVSVADLRTGPASNAPVKTFALTARQKSVTVPSGRAVDAWTFGSLPGPEIRVQQGDLVEVTVHNRDIQDGVTVHWHGYRVPAGEDGVAGVTQDAIRPGESFTYRFVARDAGTYWYHAHQVSSEAVARGLYGALIVDPSLPADPRQEFTLPLHTIDGVTMIGATDLVDQWQVAGGEHVRLRLINTDAVPHRISVEGTAFTVAAVDGSELIGSTSLSGQVLRIPAGGRYDVEFDMPEAPVRVAVEGAPATGLILAPSTGSAPGAADAPFDDGADLDLLGYGTPVAVPGMTGVAVDREATLVLDRQFRFLGGVPTFAQTVNGEVHPHVPPIEVRDGELVRITVANRSAETHPMHPHGHRVLVESRDGIAFRGSPLWLDTFDVRPGETWVVLLRADNPGIWMAHCHNLDHARQGMVVHLVYEGISTPFDLGGAAGNRPE
jgi:FtsP/CotA-like multicopper oxidase with cupredoxin domain